jgi:hypothetical protein
MTNNITMVVETLTPPVAWMLWIHAAGGVGVLPHIFFDAAVEQF